jgi:hypothetical protein
MQGPFIYQLIVNDGQITKDRNFEAPTTMAGQKIYVISQNRSILYVGITKQSIANRFRAGQNAHTNPINGYYGYRWLNENRNLTLSIYVADQNEISNDDQFVETVEAEIAYLIRNIDGQWPEDQTEIHFHQSSEIHRCASLKIVNDIKNRM